MSSDPSAANVQPGNDGDDDMNEMVEVNLDDLEEQEKNNPESPLKHQQQEEAPVKALDKNSLLKSESSSSSSAGSGDGAGKRVRGVSFNDHDEKNTTTPEKQLDQENSEGFSPHGLSSVGTGMKSGMFVASTSQEDSDSYPRDPSPSKGKRGGKKNKKDGDGGGDGTTLWTDPGFENECPCCSPGVCPCCFTIKERVGDFRHVPVCDSHDPLKDEQITKEFGDNMVYTTKYSLKPWKLNFFLWRMTYEQFLRKANIYFLIIGCIQIIPGISPTGQFTTISTLVLVLLFSFLKNGVEDIARYKRDREINSKTAHVLKSFDDKDWRKLTYADIRVGDIVRVDNIQDDHGNRNNEIPCDMIVLSSSESDGTCYVETANLDGETNLKMRKINDLSNIYLTVTPQMALQAQRAREREEQEDYVGDEFKMSFTASSPNASSAASAAASAAAGGAGGSSGMLESAPSMSSNPSLVGSISSPFGPSPGAAGPGGENSSSFVNTVVGDGMSPTSRGGGGGKKSGGSGGGKKVETNMTALAAQCQEKYRGLSAECEHPNMSLYKFSGNLKHELWAPDSGLSVGPQQTLYRGCSLRKVKWAIGLCIFTGHETKLMNNASDPPHKASRVERMVNKLMLIVLVLQAILCVICTIGTALIGGEQWYLKSSTSENRHLTNFEAFLTFVILTNNFIPISLYVSLEFIKYYQGRLLEQDLCMYYPPKDMPAVAKATDLNEELGQINFVFCDKTGTLTRNVMHFLKFGVDGEIYGRGTTEIGRAAAKRKGIKVKDDRPQKVRDSNDPFWDPRMVDNRWVSLSNAENIRQFFMALAICHTVVVDAGKYEAESPDEEALVRAAKRFGFAFVARRSDHILIETKNGKLHRIEILETLHFNSDRKRMSVICRLPQGEVIIYCKGAETMLFPRLRPGTDVETAEQIQTSFAMEGLRPLVITSKSLDEKFAHSWLKKMRKARAMIGRDTERDAIISQLSVEVEHDLRLVGITGVEDKLQDQVPETVLALRQAGMSVWMLTGDKKETAVNIGYACDFLHKEMHVVELHNYRPDKEADEKRLQKKILKGASYELERDGKDGENGDMACVVDGNTLGMCLATEQFRVDFYSLVKRCSSVICCRVSPKQKADVVKMMMEHSNDGVTSLAIGDGANDVPMIQAAHVGVGISGMEGQQAANSADFAIGQFKHLHRLVMVHGRANYARLTLVINYFFYKNALLVMTQFWYSLFNLFTGQSLYEQWSLALWNVVFTSIPVLVVGILDREILNTDRVHQYPALYKRGPNNDLLNFSEFTGWICVAVAHSAIAFYSVIFGTSGSAGFLTTTKGVDMQLDGSGITLYTVIILIATGKFALHVKSFTAYHWVALIGSVVAWFGFLVVYSGVQFSISSTLYGVLENVGFELIPWLFGLLVCLIALLPDIMWKFSRFNMFLWFTWLDLRVREAITLLDADDALAAIRIPQELVRRKQQRLAASREDGEEEDTQKARMFKSVQQQVEESIHSRQTWILDFVDQEVEDAFRDFHFGDLRRYKVGLGICAVVSLAIVANFARTSVRETITQVELGGWVIFSLVAWIGFLFVMIFPCFSKSQPREYIHYVMTTLLVVAFSGMSIANLKAAERNPNTHPVTNGVILLGIIVLLRPPLVHALLYVIINTVLYIVWYQMFKVAAWSLQDVLARILELIIVAITSLIALAATERFSRKVFISQLMVKRAVKAVTREEKRSMLLLENVFPKAIVNEVHETKRPLAAFSATFIESSMLNSDIVSFTNFSSSKEPHVVVEMLNRMFTKFDAHAAVLGLEKIKTIGDAYLCAGGIPVPDPYHAQKVISMGRRMVHSMFEMNKEGIPSLPHLDLHIRVGCATGPIRAGVIGLQKACFDVFGEVSEDSELMESSGLPDRVQVTNEMYDHAKEHFKWEKIPNKLGLQMWFVLDDGIEPEMGLRPLKEVEAEQRKKAIEAGDINEEEEAAELEKEKEEKEKKEKEAAEKKKKKKEAAAAAKKQGGGEGGSVEPSPLSSRSNSFSGNPLADNTAKVVVASSAQSTSLEKSDNSHQSKSASPNSIQLDASSRHLEDALDGLLNREGDSDDDDDVKKEGDSPSSVVTGSIVAVASGLKPITNEEKELQDLYKFLEDTNAERLDIVETYKGFDGETGCCDLNYSLERAEEEFRLYYRSLAESRAVLETVQGFLIFGICALLVALHVGTVSHWFIIAQIAVSGVHVILVFGQAIYKRMPRKFNGEVDWWCCCGVVDENDEAKKMGFDEHADEEKKENDVDADDEPNPADFTKGASSASIPSQKSAFNFKREMNQSFLEKEDGLGAGGGGGGGGGAAGAERFDDDVIADSDSDSGEIDPTSPQFSIRNHNEEDTPFCNLIRAFAFSSGLLSFSMPIILVTLVDNDGIEVIMVFVMLASVVYITSFLHMRFVMKVVITVLHLAGVTAAFFARIFLLRSDGLKATEDGGQYLAVVLCYVLCIISSYTTEVNVRNAFSVAKKVVFQNAELLSSVDLCDKLLNNVLPSNIVRRMIADPTKAIVDEVDEASVLFLYTEGIRPKHEEEVKGKKTGRLVNDMNDFLFIMDCLCMYHRVEKIKTVPYLVVSGCPEPITRHCQRLACLARDVIRFAESYNARNGTNIKVKCGLHSGKVTAGVLGATKFIYDVFGDTVNFASRLASGSDWSVVQCSEQSRRLVSDIAEVIDLGPKDFKGKGVMNRYSVDLNTIKLPIAPMVREMVHAGAVDLSGFKDFDPHQRINPLHMGSGSFKKSSENALDGASSGAGGKGGGKVEMTSLNRLDRRKTVAPGLESHAAAAAVSAGGAEAIGDVTRQSTFKESKQQPAAAAGGRRNSSSTVHASPGQQHDVVDEDLLDAETVVSQTNSNASSPQNSVGRRGSSNNANSASAAASGGGGDEEYPGMGDNVTSMSIHDSSSS